jgi:hypothetical protein
MNKIKIKNHLVNIFVVAICYALASMVSYLFPIEKSLFIGFCFGIVCEFILEVIDLFRGVGNE